MLWCNAVGRIGPAARDAVPLLRDSLTPDYNFDYSNAYAAAVALARLWPSVKEAAPDIPERIVPILADTIASGSPGHVNAPGIEEAIEALGAMGPVARKALPALRKVLQNPRTDPFGDTGREPSPEEKQYAQALRKAAAEAIQNISGEKVEK